MLRLRGFPLACRRVRLPCLSLAPIRRPAPAEVAPALQHSCGGTVGQGAGLLASRSIRAHQFAQNVICVVPSAPAGCQSPPSCRHRRRHRPARSAKPLVRGTAAPPSAGLSSLPFAIHSIRILRLLPSGRWGCMCWPTHPHACYVCRRLLPRKAPPACRPDDSSSSMSSLERTWSSASSRSGVTPLSGKPAHAAEA